jgi:2-polyprenyl-3-methyl-5-hydroxy-6-metoxy-1,4-benzoquinol methylase
MDKNKIINIVNEITDKINEIKEILSDFDETNELSVLKNLLNSEDWPESVFDFQIADRNSEDEKMDRAEGIVDIVFDEKLTNKKFLDFGCGEGHVVKYLSKDTAISVGYEIEKPSNCNFEWEVENEYLLTTDFQKVKEKGPYDVILIYDVLDHAEDSVKALTDAKSLLGDGGKIYLRCHPWCGRHGGHCYRKVNKAFVHLIFTEKELDEMGFTPEEKTNKVLFPLGNYSEMIEESGLIKVQEENVERQSVENFFSDNPIIVNRLKKLFKLDGFPNFQMEQCFLDYVLMK